MSDAPSDYTGVLTSDDWMCKHCSLPMRDHSCLNGFARTEYKIVGMMRVHNEAPWIAEVIEGIRPLCDKIFILDDHSTDNTVEVCMRYHPQVDVLPSHFTGLNERRDKNWLLDEITRRCKAELILCIDGDEVMEPSGPDIIRGTIDAHPNTASYVLKIAFLWNNQETWRVDRIYNDFWRPSLFRPFHEDPNKPDDRKLLNELRFMATPFGRAIDGNEPNLHCSSVPQRFIHGCGLMPVRLKHYGYMSRESRVKKLDYYTSIDWKNAAEDCYRHMTQGDNVQLSELPRVQAMLAAGTLTQGDVDYLITATPDMRLVHAGPLELAPWDVDTPWVPSDWALGQYRGTF